MCNVLDMNKTSATSEQGRALRTLREVANLTADQVAREAQVSASYLSRVENGKAEATPQWIGMITATIAAHLSGAAA